jgi:hypothetical protein
MDIHQVLEERLARFMGTEEAILYSYDVATLPSVLPAFASRKDIIVIDELCPWPHHNGACLSRAKGPFLLFLGCSEVSCCTMPVCFRSCQSLRPERISLSPVSAAPGRTIPALASLLPKACSLCP